MKETLFLAVVLSFATSALADEQPTQFVTQVLEPTGGKIVRPKEWFYAERHHGPVFVWTISREDPSDNRPYITGLSIQTFMHVKEGTGKTAEEFLRAFAAERMKEATKVIKTCKAQEQGLFVRMCLETEERGFHVLYSLFWGSNGMDLAVVTTAGTTKELWTTYAATFDKMSAFEIIDMKRFVK
jgi:hypothetical protein